MRDLRDKTVAVTGAASGIGRALAEELVARGARVALSDVNEAGLEETRARLKGASGVSLHTVDVRDRAQVEAYAADTVEHHGRVDAIINNAGATVRGTFEELDYDDIEFVVDVCFWGVLYGVKAFLPYLKQRPEAHIVNIASINAEVPFFGNGPYNAAKHAVSGLTQTLEQELAGTSVGVTCVYPGGIRTNIVRNARHTSEEDAAGFDRLARTSPNSAARQILEAMTRPEPRKFIGRDAQLMSLAKKLAPRSVVKLVGRASRGPIG